MARFLGVRFDGRKVRRANGRRPKQQPCLERLESRLVLDSGLASGSSLPVTATAGTTVANVPLATFTDGTSPLPASDYSATISWGDGTALSGAVIVLNGTTFTVEGSHSFGQPSAAQPGGVDPVTVVITGDGQQISMSTTATVDGLTYQSLDSNTNPMLPIEVVPPMAMAGSPTSELGFSGFYATPTPDPTAYSATVDWGDATAPVVASIESAGSGALVVDVSGHTYAVGGAYTIQIVVRDTQGYVVGTGTESMVVESPAFTPNSPLTATAGSNSGSLTLGTFVGTENNGFQSSYYSAEVDWGDGSPSTAAIIDPFAVNAVEINSSGHTFSQAGTYTLTVTLRDAQGAVVDTFNPTILVNPAGSGGQKSTGGSDGVASGPLVESVKFKRASAAALVIYEDRTSALDLSSISEASKYRLAVGSSAETGHKRLVPTSISVVSGASPTSPVTVKIVFNHGKPLHGRLYELIAKGTVSAEDGSATFINISKNIR
jgi:hypothetical protein